eukprot:1793107-Rhodomonas_salina.1
MESHVAGETNAIKLYHDTICLRSVLLCTRVPGYPGYLISQSASPETDGLAVELALPSVCKQVDLARLVCRAIRTPGYSGTPGTNPSAGSQESGKRNGSFSNTVL